MTTQAQRFVAFISDAAQTRTLLKRLEKAGGTFSHRFQENRFYIMPDQSRVIVSDAHAGRMLIRAAPAKEEG